jgi:glycosyltransferase 2 family protein
VPFLDNMAFATLAILAGLLPFTMAGIGTRDAAILFLYAPWLSAGQAAVLGVLATLRYLLPAIAGLPFMGDYLDRRRMGDGS